MRIVLMVSLIVVSILVRSVQAAEKQPIAGEEWKTDKTGEKGEILPSVAHRIRDDNPRRFYGL